MKSGNIFTCPANGTGWYQISYYLHHPELDMLKGSESDQNGLGQFTIGIRFINTETIEYTALDRNMGSPDTCNYIATVWLVANDRFEFIFSTGPTTWLTTDGLNEDYLVRISILRLTNGTGNTIF
jgi:hypothetical protein